jgi:hypothetical protein
MDIWPPPLSMPTNELNDRNFRATRWLSFDLVVAKACAR